MIPASGRVLGVDWGSSRIGLAISDETQLIATPLEVLRYRTGKRLPLGEFLTVIEREHPVGLVVGIPLDDHGREGASARSARAMGTLFAERSRLPVAWIDESFSTADVKHRAGPPVDAHAAAEILRRWLDGKVRSEK
ncbi:MAG: RuvX/YqgF family protein [Gemmatimonadales bacterium]